MSGPARDAFSSGAARAAGERRRRQGTPLVSVGAGPAARDSSEAPVERSRPHRPVPQSTPTAPPSATTVDGVERSPRARPAFDITAALTEATVSVLPAASARVGGVARTKRPRTPAPVESPSAGPSPADSTPRRPSRAAIRAGASRPAAAPTGVVPTVAAPTGVVPTGVVPTVAPVEAPSGEPAAYPPPLAGGQPAPELSDSLLSAALNQREVSPDIEDVLAAVIAVLRTLAAASGLGADEVELAVARMLAFTRRRLSGDYTVDDFGFDPDFVEHVFLPIARLLYRQWFRVEVRGIEHLPTTGSALLVANHSGTIALDAHMLQVAVHDEHPAQRNLRLLGADLVFRTPVVGTIARKQGATLASNADAERLLSSGEIVAVFPEGFKGVGKPFRERYKLQRFGRGGFVNAAVRTGAPIIPVSIIGAEETYPLIGDIRLLARLLGAPYFPVTPTWPLLGPLGLLPLPSKWIIEFGAPVPTADFGPHGADDPMLVFDLTDQVRETIQQTLYSLLMQRRSVFS